MCGSGRLLLPLLKKGYQIDGVDSSHEMLESCAKRCQTEQVSASLFNQSMQNLALPKKYGVIFIAIGSFQLIEDRFEALTALQNLHQHLLPGGSLLIDTYIPWDAIRDCIEGSSLNEKAVIPYERKVSSPEGFEITLKGKTTIKPKEQLEIGESEYQKMKGQKVIATEEERLAVRWYYRYEMELLLKMSGFEEVNVFDESFELSPQSTIYQALKVS